MYRAGQLIPPTGRHDAGRSRESRRLESPGHERLKSPFADTLPETGIWSHIMSESERIRPAALAGRPGQAFLSCQEFRRRHGRRVRESLAPDLLVQSVQSAVEKRSLSAGYVPGPSRNIQAPIAGVPKGYR